MPTLHHVSLAPLPPERFAGVLDEEEYARFTELIARATERLAGRVVWNVSSTARGGGVAELLRSLVGYARGAGVDARWAVVDGDEQFFHVTKRLHNRLHGAVGDGGELGEEARRCYERALGRAAAPLTALVGPGDVVLLHDPQTAGLVEAVRATGAHTIWRAHVGLDLPNARAREAWAFLQPYVASADAYVFSRRDFAWDVLDREKVTIIPPSIDAFAPKNRDLAPATVDAILAAAGLVPDGVDDPVFTRADGTPGRVDRRAQMHEDRPLTPADPIVLQVSRWDRLKDPVGVLRGFADHVAPSTRAHLVLAGPEVAAVSDDPEGGAVLAECERARRALPREARERIHLATLPMADAEENAAMVNALQRRAAVVVQKSLAEGFGLTVAEAMWKSRPVVASRVGGIQEQIVDGQTGLLLDDPGDLSAFGAAVRTLLADPDRAADLGRAAHEEVRRDFLGPRHLAQYFALIDGLLARDPGARRPAATSPA